MPRWFFRKSIKVQLTTVLFGLTAISIVAVGFIGIRAVLVSGGRTEQMTSSAMQARVEQFLVQATDATAARNSVIFKNIQYKTTSAGAYMINVLDNPSRFSAPVSQFDATISRDSAGHLTSKPSDPGSVYIDEKVGVTNQVKRNVVASGYLDSIFPSILQNEPNAVAIYYTGASGETRYYPNVNLPSLVAPDYKVTEDVFFAPVNPQNNPERAVKWSPVYDDPAGHGLLVSSSGPLYDKNNTFQGIVGMDVSLSDVAKNIESYSPIESSYAFLIDTSGRAVALPENGYKDILGRSPKKGEFGPDLKNIKGDFANVIHEMRTGQKGYMSLGNGDAARYVAYAPVSGTPFSLAIVAQRSTLLQVVSDLRTDVHSFTSDVLYYQIIPIASIILLLVWLFGFFYIRLMTGPIILLTERTKQITQGDFRQASIVATSKEVSELAAAFNQMARELAGLYEDLEQKMADHTKVLSQRVRELSTAKAKDDAILDSIGEGLMLSDSKGRISMINDSAALLLGVPHAQAVGMKIVDIALYDEFGKPIADKDRPVTEALGVGHKVSRVVTVRYKDKKQKTLSITITPVRQKDEIIGTIEILRDITKEKEIDRMKTEFLSIASHQLRTPLSAIKWYGEMLLGQDVGKLNDQQIEFMRYISGSTERMIELVGSLLNISRLESGRIIIDPKPTDLAQLLHTIVSDLDTKIAERKQKITVHVDSSLQHVNLDPKLIGQVYLNLLSNAIKYTPQKGRITITVAVKGKDIVSCIADNGYGIPREEQRNVFKKFFRASNIIKAESDGTGLGMYLVKAIVSTAGGKIWFESKENKGTTFWFTIPAQGMQPKSGEVEVS